MQVQKTIKFKIGELRKKITEMVKQKAKGLQKQGIKVLEQVQDQREALPAAAAKKAKSLKKAAVSVFS